jgi:hypothetical protein
VTEAAIDDRHELVLPDAALDHGALDLCMFSAEHPKEWGGATERRRKTMRARRTLLGIAACSVASLALVTASAQAAPTATGGTGSAPHALTTPAKFKIKGASVYEYCGTESGCPSEYYLATYGKSKTWEFVDDPGFGGYYYKYKKVTYFIYDDGAYDEECYLAAYKYKTEYYDGGFYCDFGEGYKLYEEWYAIKI